MIQQGHEETVRSGQNDAGCLSVRVPLGTTVIRGTPDTYLRALKRLLGGSDRDGRVPGDPPTAIRMPRTRQISRNVNKARQKSIDVLYNNAGY